MKEDGIHSLVYSKNVIELITVANEFCSFLERSDEMESADFMGRLQKILPLLYIKAALIPEIDFEPEEDLVKYVTEVEYNLIQQKVLQHTGANDDYREIFLPGAQFSEEALTSAISENVADIYQDMKDLIMSFRTMDEEVMAQALRECQMNFTQFWGQKLVNGLRAIHNVIYSDKNGDDDIRSEKQNPKKTRRKPDWLTDRFSYQEDDE